MSPDPERFLIEYRHAGYRYSITIPAHSWEDAEVRLKAIAETGRVIGRSVAVIPINSLTLPFAGALATFVCWLRNLWSRHQ